MSTLVHKHVSRIVRQGGRTRKAVIQGFPGEVYYGVHGGIKDFYKVEPREEHPATLDHMITAIAAGMMGTLAGVLAARQIGTPEENYRADVEGDIEDVGSILKITRIRVNYHLKVLPEKEGAAREAL